MGTNNIVLVHGLWMTPLSWEYWAHHYTERGYSVYAPSWPGMERDIRALRRTPEAYANIGFRQIVDHYEKLVLDLESAPILIGHSFGGLVVQALLDRGLGACGVAVASAPIKGIWTFPYSTMRVVTPQFINPRNNRRCVPLTPAQFHYAFMNTSSREESFRIYQRYAVPGPDHVLFQTELANFNPFAETAVNIRRNNRAPLLMIAGRAGSRDSAAHREGQREGVPPFHGDDRIQGVRRSHALHHRPERLGGSGELLRSTGRATRSCAWRREQRRIVAAGAAAAPTVARRQAGLSPSDSARVNDIDSADDVEQHVRHDQRPELPRARVHIAVQQPHRHDRQHADRPLIQVVQQPHARRSR